MPPSSGELVLLARVARRFYLEDVPKNRIADEFGISRFKVARLLETARREGVVTIRIEPHSGVDTELSSDLQSRFGLAHAVVVADDPGGRVDAGPLRRRLGRVAAEVLQDIVTHDDVLGLAWGRSLAGIGPAVTSIAACPVVQLTGALTDHDGSDVIELVRRVARAGGGTPYVFYAPFVAEDAAAARAVRRQPDAVPALELAGRVTVAAVGIGAWAPGLSTIHDAVEPAARARAARAGTVGEISGALVDAAGRPVAAQLGRRIVGVTCEQLRQARTVVSVAYGTGKTDAVLAAIRGGLVTGLVTHGDLARALLAAG